LSGRMLDWFSWGDPQPLKWVFPLPQNLC
jgi:hypothetical protein